MGSRRVAPKRQITFDRLEDRQLLALTMSGTSISATQQQPFSGQVATVYDTNLDDSPASFNSVEINWGDGQTTAGQVVGPLTIPGVFEVIGTHTYTAAGAYSALISVSTASGANATATAKAEVAAPPFLVAVNAIATAPYTPLTDLTVATFIAPNSTATLPTDFSALINWGDGQTTIGTITGGPAAYSVTGSHTYTATGNYTTSVTVAPTNGPTSTASGQADIAYPDVYTTTSNLIVIPSNQPFTGTLATFTGTAGQSQFTGSISWGDGGTSPATVVPDPSMSGTFDINGTYTYTTPGTYPITITLADQAGNTFTAAATANITNTGPASNTPPLTGGLDDAITNGPHSASGFTNTNRPTFSGTAAPFSTVQLFARHFNADAELPLGEAVTNDNGQWSLTASPLAVGTWIFTATVTPSGGYPSGMIALTNQGGGDLVYIDLSPKLVRWLSHGEKTRARPRMVVEHPTMSAKATGMPKPLDAGHHKA